MEPELRKRIEEIIFILKATDAYTLKIYEHIGDGLAKAIVYKHLWGVEMPPPKINVLANCMVSNAMFKHAMKYEGFELDRGDFLAFHRKKFLACVFEAVLGWCYVQGDNALAEEICDGMILGRVSPFYGLLFDDVPVDEETLPYFYDNLLYIITNGEVNSKQALRKGKVIEESRAREKTRRDERRKRREELGLNNLGSRWPSGKELQQLFRKHGFDEDE